MDIRQQDSRIVDPFASQRTDDNNPFAERVKNDGLTDLGSSPSVQFGSPKQDRRMSKEWGKSHSGFTRLGLTVEVPLCRFKRGRGPFMPLRAAVTDMSTGTNKRSTFRS